MRELRIDAADHGNLSEFNVSWDKDRVFRMNPQVVTSLLREQVPVLNFVEWSVLEIQPGFARSRLPLNANSTNQHFTHQASLFVLAADYTGGTALASLLSGWPVVGVHPVESKFSASLWLLRVETKFVRASVGDLEVVAQVDPAIQGRVKKRFLAGQAVIETIAIEFRNGNLVVGEAQLTYFARRSDALQGDGMTTSRVNPLHELKLTSSAELIAGVRALESGGLFEDPFAARMAGQHGMALATRFSERSPQLRGMVAARTYHGDVALQNYLAAGGRDIVLIGVGWDMRPFRLNTPSGTTFYELDFPTTLVERNKRLEQAGITPAEGIARHQVPTDVRTIPLDQTLAEYVPGDRPLFLLWEGVSMYLQEGEVRSALSAMLRLLQHPNSLLWVDVVDEFAIRHPEQVSPSVSEFMRGMQILGEPFTFGKDALPEFLDECGLQTLEVVSSQECLAKHDDPVYGIYKFCLATAKSLAHGDRPRTFQPHAEWSILRRIDRSHSQVAATRHQEKGVNVQPSLRQ